MIPLLLIAIATLAPPPPTAASAFPTVNQVASKYRVVATKRAARKPPHQRVLSVACTGRDVTPPAGVVDCTLTIARDYTHPRAGSYTTSRVVWWTTPHTPAQVLDRYLNGYLRVKGRQFAAYYHAPPRTLAQRTPAQARPRAVGTHDAYGARP